MPTAPRLLLAFDARRTGRAGGRSTVEGGTGPSRGRGTGEVTVGPVLQATGSGRGTGCDVSDNGKDSDVVACHLSAGHGSNSSDVHCVFVQYSFSAEVPP